MDVRAGDTSLFIPDVSGFCGSVKKFFQILLLLGGIKKRLQLCADLLKYYPLNTLTEMIRLCLKTLF
ncbi:MAG: hypothetical protein A2W17_12330 [Planctomycetes bacterium RBG_16_41_13]|nr:MAG: hypothetical protein A2W17_12330 [Planctomycetes bacterium RBG_16_41_13]